MDRVAQFKLVCDDLSDADVKEICSDFKTYLGKLANHFVPFGWEKCDACGKYVDSLHEHVTAYDHHKEDVCDDCVEYCGVCEEAYAPSGNYKHEDCLYNIESKSLRQEARKCRAIWMNESEPSDTSESEDDK